jgi:hypothetical protein
MSEFGKIKNKELKKQWLADLRSGNYKQCTGQLCDTGTKNFMASYCCLGVLGRSIQKINAHSIKFIKGEITYKNVNDSETLPTCLRKEIGISPNGQDKLMELNDDYEKNFKEIADFIEKNL